MDKKLLLLDYESNFIAWIKEKNLSFITGCYRRKKQEKKTFRLFVKPKDWERGIVFFAHGTGNSSLFPVIDLFMNLINRGYGVYAFDLDGHGLNSTTLLQLESIETCIDDAVTDLMSLSDRKLKIHLLGHSLGGCLILHFLKNCRIEMTSIIVVSSPLKVTFRLNGLINEMVSPFKWSIHHQRSHYGFWGLIPAIGPFKRSSFPLRIDPGHQIFYPRLVSTIISGLNFLSSNEIDIPILLVYGRKDMIAPVSHGEKIAQQFRHGEMMVVEKGNHFTTFIDQLTTDQIIKWLNRRF